MKKTILLLFLFVVAACGSNNPSPAPTYGAHIVNMSITDGSWGLAASLNQPTLLSALTTSVQDFYSPDISSTATFVTVAVTVQNDSDVPLVPMLMTYWAPAAYPYPDTWVNKALILWCGGIGTTALQPGEARQVSANFSFGSTSGSVLSDPSLLGSQQISAYIYASSDPNFPNDICQPDPWDGTLQGMVDYVNTTPALTLGTNHFNIVP